MDWDTALTWGVLVLCVVVIVVMIFRRPKRKSESPTQTVKQCPKCGGYLPQHKPKCNYEQHGWD